ncbi:hypothetical protein [Dechloromonas sp.]|uniref:hypothetical protein n=1 Tax=Dechloromonas sp. TaxID=1917218 RepID=UPI0011F7EE16|nr:hypothetical protein [Dechloromonas sp.]MBU3695815.1 hypothetical protein [Dechloromonas sp.]TEX48191.1 MAG: hypothetical protein CFR70_08110 [Rhodocyclaceae bacterium]
MSADTHHVPAWVAAHALTPSDIDCATAVMLKILDGKCKMGEVDKLVMAALYDAVRHRPGERFGSTEHALIATARQGADDAMKNAIYERRVLAETEISRPVMKAFKAMTRAEGLFADWPETARDAS